MSYIYFRTIAGCILGIMDDQADSKPLASGTRDLELRAPESGENEFLDPAMLDSTSNIKNL